MPKQIDHPPLIAELEDIHRETIKKLYNHDHPNEPCFFWVNRNWTGTALLDYSNKVKLLYEKVYRGDYDKAD